MMLSAFSTGKVPANIAGMMAKYFATSLAIENVVSEPRVISSCLPISTTSISLVGLESRSTMLPGLFSGLCAGVHRHADIRLGQRGSVVGTIARHRDELAFGLFAPDQVHLVFRRGLRQEVVDPGFARNRRRGQADCRR